MSETRYTPEQMAENADWGQVVCNGGPPCFHAEGNRFCLRAERWPGHASGSYEADHKFVSLAELLRSQAATDAEALEEFWREVERGFDIEPRAYFETEAPKIGFSSPITMALHHVWKRDPRVAEALAAKDRHIAALEQENFEQKRDIERHVQLFTQLDGGYKAILEGERGRLAAATTEIARLTVEVAVLKGGSDV